MKELSFEQMERIEGGDVCSTTAWAMGAASLAFGFAALAFPLTSPIGALMVSQTLVFGAVGTGVGAVCLYNG